MITISNADKSDLFQRKSLLSASKKTFSSAFTYLFDNQFKIN